MAAERILPMLARLGELPGAHGFEVEWDGIRAPAAAKDATVEVDGRTLRLTSLGKVLYPAAGYTKAAVLSYYARIAPTLLPHLRGRAMTLKRYPGGVAGPHFYDKHCSGRPDWLPT